MARHRAMPQHRMSSKLADLGKAFGLALFLAGLSAAVLILLLTLIF